MHVSTQDMHVITHHMHVFTHHMHVITHVVGLSGVKIVQYIWCGIDEMMRYDAFRFHLDTGQTKCVDSSLSLSTLSKHQLDQVCRFHRDTSQTMCLDSSHTMCRLSIYTL